MNAYMMSRLALDVGVSVHIMHDCPLHELLRPVAYTPGGCGLFNETILQRLYFVRSALKTDIGLDALARLFRALDTAGGGEAATQLAVLRQSVECQREALADLGAQLATLSTEPAQHTESPP